MPIKSVSCLNGYSWRVDRWANREGRVETTVPRVPTCWSRFLKCLSWGGHEPLKAWHGLRGHLKPRLAKRDDNPAAHYALGSISEIREQFVLDRQLRWPNHHTIIPTCLHIVLLTRPDQLLGLLSLFVVVLALSTALLKLSSLSCTIGLCGWWGLQGLVPCILIRCIQAGERHGRMDVDENVFESSCEGWRDVTDYRYIYLPQGQDNVKWRNFFPFIKLCAI